MNAFAGASCSPDHECVPSAVVTTINFGFRLLFLSQYFLFSVIDLMSKRAPSLLLSRIFLTNKTIRHHLFFKVGEEELTILL